MTLRRLRPAVLLLAAALAGCTTAPPAPAGSAASSGPSASLAPSFGPIASVPASAPSASVPASAAATATIPPIAAGWHEVWPASGSPKLLLRTVLATPLGFVSAGSAANGRTPAAIASADGVRWASESIPGDGRAPAELAAWGDRILAAGAGGAACAHPYGLDTWVRSAKGTWSEAPFTDLLCDAEDVRIGFVGDVAILAGSGPGDNPIVWSSTDGLHWVDHGGPFSGLLPKAVMTIGGRTTVLAEGPTATWSSTSTNGSVWTKPTPIPGLPAGLALHGVFQVDGAPTFIASIGDVLETIRPDGGTGWTTTPSTGLTSAELGTITAYDGGLLAAGGNGPGAQAWVSRDGVAWRKLALPAALGVDGAHVAAVAVRDGRAILIGSWAVGAADATSTIWTGPASLLAP